MAKATGAKRSNQRNKDQSRAADLKARNVVRKTMRCPVCNNMVKVAGFPTHLESGCRAN